MENVFLITFYTLQVGGAEAQSINNLRSTGTVLTLVWGGKQVPATLQ